VFDHFHAILKEEGPDVPVAAWIPVVADRMYVPSNDFSCMVSNAMFREFFLEGIAEECRFYTNSVYHLDGPGALRHLDDLLDIPELNAIQWVPGAGHTEPLQWMHVYKRVQAGGKSIMIYDVEPGHLDSLMDELSPEGLYLNINGVPDEETGKEVIKKLLKWK